ncbi:hypothetical protein KU06112801_580010 [Flavobacterium psychrophilum]|nr:hypothetical protein KU06112801_580010 [Flavobacterium psychrophilum]SNB37674.1 hypothetical protein NO098_40032 [Flavobacterium psychrophilum]
MFYFIKNAQKKSYLYEYNLNKTKTSLAYFTTNTQVINT